jgi:hypothetical protein
MYGILILTVFFIGISEVFYALFHILFLYFAQLTERFTMSGARYIGKPIKVRGDVKDPITKLL